MRRLRGIAGLALLANALCAQVVVSGRIVDEIGAPVPGALVEFRSNTFGNLPAVTADVQGRFRLELPQPGEYLLRAERTGFFVLDRVRIEFSEGPNDVSVVLNHLRELVESLDVVYSPPAIDPVQTSDQRHLNNLEVQAIPYPAAQDIRNALPMFPGVVQDSQNVVHFNGGASNQASYSLDEFNIADPATGRFEARVNTEAVRNLDLESGRFAAATGRGVAGALNLETGMGDDRFRFGATNFIPGVSAPRGLVLNKWTPRITLSGPIARGRAWFHDGFDAFYDVDTIPELPKGQDRSRSLTISNLSRIQVNVRPANILTGSYLINYTDEDNQGLSFLEPVETTIDRRRSFNLGTIRDQAYFPGGMLLEVGFAASRGVLREGPQGTRPYVIEPQGRRGNYFVDLDRQSDRQQWLATLHFPAWRSWGTHRLSIGADGQRFGFDAQMDRHELQILRTDGSLARSVAFFGGGRLQRRNFESALYVQDSWTPREGLILEFGARGDWDQIVRRPTVLPRISAAWSPARLRGTKISAGLGVFSDTLNLQLLARPQDQSSLTTFFSRDGAQQSPPLATRFSADENPMRSPRARIYSLSLERTLPLGVQGKASYLRRVEWNGFTFAEPAEGMPPAGIDYSLRNQRNNRYDALEFTARRSYAGRYEWFGSYTYSRARTNTVVSYSLENPIFGRQSGGPLDWDTPHRFVSWGSAPVPVLGWNRLTRFALRELSAAYLLEIHTGYPFTVVNEENFMVGLPNRLRLPGYFNLNFHFEKKFRLLHCMWAWRFGFNNLTNHGNPNVVNNNIDSPSFLAYGRGQRRAWNVRLRFLGRK